MGSLHSNSTLRLLNTLFQSLAIAPPALLVYEENRGVKWPKRCKHQTANEQINLYKCMLIIYLQADLSIFYYFILQGQF